MWLLVLVALSGSPEPIPGHWGVRWEGPAPEPARTGTLVLRRVDERWVGSLTLGRPYRGWTLVSVDGSRFSFGDDGATLTLELDPGVLTATGWHPESVGAATVALEAIAPPAELSGSVLRPFGAGLPAPPSELRPPETFAWKPHAEPRLSGDGRRVWTFAPNAGVTALWTGAADEPGALRRVVSHGAPQGWWDSDPAGSAVYLAVGDAIERISAAGERSIAASDLGKVRWVEPRWAEGKLFVATARDGFRLLEVDLQTGSATERYAHPSAEDVVFFPDWGPRFVLQRDRILHGQGAYAEIVSIHSAAGLPLGLEVLQSQSIVDRDPVPRVGNGPVYLLGGRDLSTLGTLGRTGFLPVPVPGPPGWSDATSLVPDPETGAIDALGRNAERVGWTALTGDGEELGWLESALGTDVNVAQRVAGDRRWVVFSFAGDQPRRYHVFDRDDRTVRLVGSPEVGAWRPVQAARLTARDGVAFSAYLTRPDPLRFGTGPWPLVVLVHGGPWSSRFTWTLERRAQKWADRGYATLAVNFRGTAGFGWESLQRESFSEDRMLHDVEDAVAWAVAERAADSSRIAVVGSSFGGYAALRFAGATDSLARCTVAGLPRASVMTQLETYGLGGAGLAEFAERLDRPLLVWSGGLDGPNPDAGIAGLVGLAVAGGKPVTWVRFPWEAHGLEQSVNAAALEGIEDHFLGACLGGPSWEFPPDFADAELEVRAGVAGVPGLADRVRSSGAGGVAPLR